MRDINVALIGYAFMGRAHSNAWRQVTSFFTPRLRPRLKVLCGRSEAGVEAAARRFGWDEAATDWRAVIERPDIDLVDICTPDESHAEIAIAAAGAGKTVLCEKPLATSARDAERMLAAVQRAGVLHMICHNYRRVPAVMLAKGLIRDGRIGRIRHFRGTYLQDWIVDPQFPRVWRLDRRRTGAGALGDIGSHVVDLARSLVGEIAEVAGATETFVKRRPLPEDPSRRAAVTVDDAAVAAVRFASGALGTIEATRMARLEPTGNTAGAFDQARRRLAIAGSIGGTLALLALLAGALYRDHLAHVGAIGAVVGGDTRRHQTPSNRGLVITQRRYAPRSASVTCPSMAA